MFENTWEKLNIAQREQAQRDSKLCSCNNCFLCWVKSNIKAADDIFKSFCRN